MNVIYGLIDPSVYELRYIGTTSNPSHRYDSHLRATKTWEAMNTWIRELRADYRFPMMEVLAESATEMSTIVERQWIIAARYLGFALLNKNQTHTVSMRPQSADRIQQIMNLQKEGSTYQAIGAIFGVSKQRIHQIVASSIRREIIEHEEIPDNGILMSLRALRTRLDNQRKAEAARLLQM
jgi:hypothetical protein